NFFFSSSRRHTRSKRDWSSDVCSSDLEANKAGYATIITSSGESTPKITEAVEALRARQVDGIIAVPHAESVDMLELVARSTPLLFIDRYIPGCAIPAVISNPSTCLKAALKALASR